MMGFYAAAAFSAQGPGPSGAPTDMAIGFYGDSDENYEFNWVNGDETAETNIVAIMLFSPFTVVLDENVFPGGTNFQVGTRVGSFGGASVVWGLRHLKNEIYSADGGGLVTQDGSIV